ncbi:Uncharacterised protein [Lacrimispora sphenoides]|uniref:Uncharacterized protein n=1 Tax=Lacrimispora sphenoides JCM 1415 TaxID=1297793 RepID=A0ABY1C5E0_9FIRM|nr:hypothetical protein SAMN02745906_1131 [[Clostridium] sphenoides JCM 1415]SUY50502.1 Uncharacterised protein [Lacrimispora sphenoides]
MKRNYYANGMNRIEKLFYINSVCLSEDRIS